MDSPDTLLSLSSQSRPLCATWLRSLTPATWSRPSWLSLPCFGCSKDQGERIGRWRQSRSQGSAALSSSDLCLALEPPLAEWSPPTGSSQTCSRTRWGKGFLEAAATHFKVSSIIHGDLEELSACLGPPRSHTLQDRSSLLLCLCPRGDAGVLLWNKGVIGKAWLPPRLFLAPVGRDWLSSALFVPPLSFESVHRIKGKGTATALGQRLSGKDMPNAERVDWICTESLGRLWIPRANHQSPAGDAI